MLLFAQEIKKTKKNKISMEDLFWFMVLRFLWIFRIIIEIGIVFTNRCQLPEIVEQGRIPKCCTLLSAELSGFAENHAYR